MCSSSVKQSKIMLIWWHILVPTFTPLFHSHLSWNIIHITLNHYLLPLYTFCFYIIIISSVIITVGDLLIISLFLHASASFACVMGGMRSKTKPCIKKQTQHTSGVIRAEEKDAEDNDDMILWLVLEQKNG